MSFWRTKNGKKITSDSIVVDSDGTTLNNFLIKACSEDHSHSNSNITNTTTSAKTYGPTLNITTTGKPLVVIASTVSYISAGNVDLFIKIDNGWYSYATHSNSNRERTIGFKIIKNLAAGSHSITLGFACSQSGRTATIPAYASNSILAFEI